MKQPIQSVIRFMRREVVLTAAVLLALLSSVFVGPANLDLSYIDWNTLALLFGLMAVMKGFQKAGMFLSLGSRLLEGDGIHQEHAGGAGFFSPLYAAW